MYDYDYLAHHGVKGMRWGVRKDKNRSANTVKKPQQQSAAKNYEVARYNSYTTMAKAGGTAINTLKASTERREKEAYNRRLAAAKKAIDLSSMSDDDLKKAVARMNLEKQYRDLKTAPEVEMGKSRALSFLEYAGDIVAIAGGITTILATTKAMKNMK